MKYLRIITLLSFLSILWSGYCLAQEPAKVPIKITVSFSILADMVKQVSGDHADIHVLVGPEQEMHDFEPSTSDAISLTGSDLIFINGLNFDDWVIKLISAAAYKGPLIIASQSVSPLRHNDHGDMKSDPHAWQDVKNAIIYVRNIIEALCQADPMHAADYQTRGAVYLQELEKLDQEIRDKIAQVPKPKRKIITDHDAFAYFSAAYDIQFLTFNSTSSHSELSAKAIAQLITQIKQGHIKAVFLENIHDNRLTELIYNETGARANAVVYSDALSKPQGPAVDYLTLMRYNTENFVKGMQEN